MARCTAAPIRVAARIFVDGGARTRRTLGARATRSALPAPRAAARTGDAHRRLQRRATANGGAHRRASARSRRDAGDRGAGGARQPREPDLWLVFAPIKRARLDFMVREGDRARRRAASGRSSPSHTIVTRVNHERLRANAIEAAEQCERLTRARDLPSRLALDEALAGVAEGARGSSSATRAAAARRSSRRCAALRRSTRPQRRADRARRRLRARHELDALQASAVCYARRPRARASCAPTRPRSPRSASVQAVSRTGVTARRAPRLCPRRLAARTTSRRSTPCPDPSVSAARPSPTARQLVEHIAGGAKPRRAWRIGTEHEKFVFDRDDLRRVAL